MSFCQRSFQNKMGMCNVIVHTQNKSLSIKLHQVLLSKIYFSNVYSIPLCNFETIHFHLLLQYLFKPLYLPTAYKVVFLKNVLKKQEEH